MIRTTHALSDEVTGWAVGFLAGQIRILVCTPTQQVIAFACNGIIAQSTGSPRMLLPL